MAHLARRSGKAVAPEKSTFSQTCNRLSQYLKERGSFGNISHGITLTPEFKGSETPRTLNLLPNIENSTEASTKEVSADIKPMQIELFPQSVTATTDPVQDLTNKAADLRKPTSKEDPTTSQMTIFYAGKVIIFEDFPAEKAKEIFDLATKGTSTNVNGSTCTPATVKANIPADDPPNKVQEPQLQLQADGSDLPIARRASLHRFLEKRKDRVAAKAPYQINNVPSSSSAHPGSHRERSDLLIDLECPKSNHLELRL